VSRHLAGKGWLCSPVLKRLTAFDGRVLQGVIPGKGVGAVEPNDANMDAPETKLRNHPPQQVTLMMAFWRRLWLRDHGSSSKVGAGKAFPMDTEWAKILRQPFQPASVDQRETVLNGNPTKLDHVYETVGGGTPWTPRMGMPEYDEIYQGF
jgi:hypothetical protein